MKSGRGEGDVGGADDGAVQKLRGEGGKACVREVGGGRGGTYIRSGEADRSHIEDHTTITNGNGAECHAGVRDVRSVTRAVGPK